MKHFLRKVKNFLLNQIFLASGGCYFPVDVQGEYVTQSMIDSEIAYTSVTITYDSISGNSSISSISSFSSISSILHICT